MNERSTVFVVEDDRGTREAICELVQLMNLGCQGYSSGREFLASCDPDQPGCAVLAVDVPDLNGLAIQQQLAAREIPLPVIFVTKHNDVSLAVQAMRAGAVHYLEKPLRTHELWDAIQEALQLDQRRRRAQTIRREIRQRLSLLSAKERQVLDCVAEGKANRQIAAELGVSVRAIEVRRSKLMRKLGVKTPLDLIYYGVAAADLTAIV
jgi:RNA polymerase sigma factor (sigma-70 family)